ncbi:T9SS type A sorting domain-containing protein [Asinibacterium sp. OR53]|jgi:hypothetical protein|uniref:T9SS type A sorting domain-containing protein n=1 Tax=Asinibacterium sp. OR53 TaxID=925409 RepID=UPI00047D63B3|nr:T9SS type A sorting domain-containing protein [Asinibacterium sp. OR53]
MKKLNTVVLLVMAFFGSSFIADKGQSSFEFTDVQTKIIRFYPNPATTVISFEFDKSVDKSYSLQIYNFIGKKMTEIRVNESKITIPLDDNYFRGLYIYQLRDANSRIVESGKFQVNK